MQHILSPKQLSRLYTIPEYIEEEDDDFIAHRPKISSNLKTSSTVLDDDEDLDSPKEVIITTDEDESTTEDDTSGGYVVRSSSREIGVGGDKGMDDSSGFLDVPRHGMSVGSPGVPGRPILHTARPSPQHGHGGKMRKARSGEGLKQSVFGKNSHLVDTATQTANNASTQTSDTENDKMMRSASPDYPMLLVNSHSIDPRSGERMRNYQQEVSHRRSVSWDPPSMVVALGGDAKNPKSMVMLSQILKEKRDQLLHRELEIKKEKEQRQQEQRQQEQQREQHREREREQQIRQQEQQLRQQEQQRLQEQQQREEKRERDREQLRIQEQQRLQDQQLRQQMAEQMPRSNHPHRRRESTTALTKLVMPMGSPSSLPPTPLNSHHIPTSSHAQAFHVTAHHHRSKSDPNVIPPLLRGLHTPHSPQRSPVGGYGASPQLASALAALNAAAAAQGIPPPPSSTSLRTKSQQESSPRSASSLSHRKSVHIISPASTPIPSGSAAPSSPITDKQKELMELEKRIEAKQKQLHERGYSVAPFVPREERRRDWSSILEVKDDALLSSLEDIEEEIELIKQRTIDIQGKVQLLERCVAPDPLSMMFGDHGTKRTKRISPYKPTSPTYHVVDPPSFASPHTFESPYKRIHKHRPTSPQSYDYSIPVAPFPSSYAREPVRPTMSRSSAYPSAPSPVPVKYTAPSPVPTIPMGPDMSKRMHVGPRSAFSPPPTQEDSSAPWSHSARSAFSPPPRGNSQEDMQIHWTRL